MTTINSFEIISYKHNHGISTSYDTISYYIYYLLCYLRMFLWYESVLLFPRTRRGKSRGSSKWSCGYHWGSTQEKSFLNREQRRYTQSFPSQHLNHMKDQKKHTGFGLSEDRVHPQIIIFPSLKLAFLCIHNFQAHPNDIISSWL